MVLLHEVHRNLICVFGTLVGYSIKYCPWHEQWPSWFILVTYETSSTMRGATEVTLQHQILPLPRKMALMIDAQAWHVLCNARSIRSHPPTPNTAPVTTNGIPWYQRIFWKTTEMSFAMRGRSKHDPTWSESGPIMNPSVRNPPLNWGYFLRSLHAFCI